jgi:hypothetical protein
VASVVQIRMKYVMAKIMIATVELMKEETCFALMDSHALSESVAHLVDVMYRVDTSVR